MKFKSVLGATLVVAATLAGCAGDPPPLTSNDVVTVLEASELPAPASADGSATLGALDKIIVEVFGVPDLTREIQIDAAGGMSFPFAGPLKVAGRSPAEVEEMIERELRDGYLRNPVVSVNLAESVSQTIAVEGEVQEPGIYPAAGEMTLLRALALAGGATEYALEERVVVFREVDGQRLAGVYNLEALRSGVVADPRIYSRDLIVMGESPRRRDIDRVITVAPAFTSPLILLLTRI